MQKLTLTLLLLLCFSSMSCMRACDEAVDVAHEEFIQKKNRPKHFV